jgi:hypothetical protein
MATPGEVCNRTAELLGIDPNTTAAVWRMFRERELVTTGGRGRNAAHCVPGDVSKLLIASIGKMPLKSLYESWKRYSELPARTGHHGAKGKINGNAGKRWKIEIPELVSLKTSHAFGDGLEALIESAVSGSLNKALAPRSDEDPLYYSPRIEVRMFGPYPQADITVGKDSVGKFGFSNSVHYSDIPDERPDGSIQDIEDWAKGPRAPGESGGLWTRLSFGGDVIFALGEFLRGGSK